MSQVGQIREQSNCTSLKILKHIIKCIFFNEQSLNWIFSNRCITMKVIIFYVLLLFIPVKSITTNEVYFLNVRFITESIILSLFYYFILFLLLPVKGISSGGFIRIFLSIEGINVFMLLSLYLNKNGLVILYSIIIGWYFTLSVFAIYKITQSRYKKAIFIVSIAFLLTNFISVVLNSL